MAGMKALVGLAFTGALGLMFLMLACGLEHYGVYWPLFVLIFYITMPIPLLMAKRLSDDEGSSACRELAYFVATGITVSAFGLPVVMARAQLIKWGACCLVMAGNVAIFATILSFFFIFGADSFSWES